MSAQTPLLRYRDPLRDAFRVSSHTTWNGRLCGPVCRLITDQHRQRVTRLHSAFIRLTRFDRDTLPPVDPGRRYDGGIWIVRRPDLKPTLPLSGTDKSAVLPPIQYIGFHLCPACSRSHLPATRPRRRPKQLRILAEQQPVELPNGLLPPRRIGMMTLTSPREHRLQLGPRMSGDPRSLYLSSGVAVSTVSSHFGMTHLPSRLRQLLFFNPSRRDPQLR
jgi:hypothetical protein